MLRRWFGFGAVCCAASSLTLLVNCFSDDREETPVQVISTCNASALDVAPTSPQATVKIYVDTADSLNAAANELSTQYFALCNEVNAALGLPAGSDVTTACQPINQRAAAIRKVQPPNESPFPINWFNIAAPPTCAIDATVTTSCLAKCGATCDLSKCSQVEGTCPGTCTGTCTTEVNGACVGSCRGTCQPYLLDFCVGQCQGRCTSGNYEAICAGGCDADFIGFCGGTCTGTCDDNAINVTSVDAGADGGDAGPAPVKVPTNADGNCSGLCRGVCSSNSSGQCADACSGPYSGGLCLGLCTGTCLSGSGSGCTISQYADPGSAAPTCEGACTQGTGDAGASCSGTCSGTCSQPFTAGTCTGQLDCKQNHECDLSCTAQAQIAAKCTAPTIFETETISNPALAPVLQTFGGRLLALAQRGNALRKAAGLITGRTAADFDAVGAKGDLVRACVTQGNATAATANATLAILANADVTISH